MKHALLLAFLAAAPLAAQTRGDIWWNHVRVLAADDMQGRAIGSPEYDRAADYVIGKFKGLGLTPAAGGGWKQPVAFTRQQIDPAAVKATLSAGGMVTPIAVPDDMTVSAGGGPLPPSLSAPLVFAGYGLHMPEAGHDDFAGLDVRGKIVVVVTGGSAEISGAIKSNARSERGRYLAQAGAVGLISIATPKQVEIPWERGKLRMGLPVLYLADDSLRELDRPFVGMAFNHASAEKLFAGSGHSFADIATLADASKPVPTFALPGTLSVATPATRAPVQSYNIVAKMAGSDPKLASEYVVVSAHLDHLGVGAPMNGDAIYNGAMDDASGVASVIEIAAKLRADISAGGARPRRSLLFLIVTGEEQGLLGSRVFARAPTVPAKSIVADMNFDMPLPLWPLKTVLAHGAPESTLGADAAAVAAARGLSLVPDPLPDRNVFTRSDQFNFIRVGVPALFFKFGFALGTPEEKIERDWRANRYHSPSDDLDQPVLKDEAVKLNDYVTALTLRVANANARPSFLPASFFRRFATNGAD